MSAALAGIPCHSSVWKRNKLRDCPRPCVRPATFNADGTPRTGFCSKHAIPQNNSENDDESSKDDASTDDDICPICYTETDFAEQTFTQCGHMFCTTCLRKWLKSSNTCPLCRKEDPTRMDSDSDLSSYEFHSDSDSEPPNLRDSDSDSDSEPTPTPRLRLRPRADSDSDSDSEPPPLVESDSESW